MTGRHQNTAPTPRLTRHARPKLAAKLTGRISGRITAGITAGIVAMTSLSAIASQQEPVRDADFGAAKDSGYVARYDAKAQIDTYAALVHAAYGAAYESARDMRDAINAFLAKPTDANLAQAKFAWRNARTYYLQTEVFRFYEGPIDHGPNDAGKEGPEGRINAWPLNEAVIDYTAGAPNGGLVGDKRAPMTKAEILKRDQVNDETDVTTGWHAIEFLLWGQDTNPAGPGARPASDYAKGAPNADRRRAYLSIVTDLLVEDLAMLTNAWAPGKKDNYAATFTAMDQSAALSRILTGLATLTGFEMANERLGTALDSGEQEDEHSCFSDTTRTDFVFDAKGLRNVYFGDFGGTDGAGLDALIAALSPALNARIIANLNHVEDALMALPEPFDSILAAKKGSPPRQTAERAHQALLALAKDFEEAGRLLGVKVIIPTE